MKKLAMLVLLVSSPALADVSYVDNGKRGTHDCAKNPDFSITGNEVTLALNGTCNKVLVAGNKAKITGIAKRVLVSGNENTLELDATNTVDVTGNKNVVTWKKVIDGNKEKVSNSGTDNRVGKAK
jgi:hypothetical protein